MVTSGKINGLLVPNPSNQIGYPFTIIRGLVHGCSRFLELGTRTGTDGTHSSQADDDN